MIKLHVGENTPILINLELVRTMKPMTPSGTLLTFEPNHEIAVNENFNQLAEALRTRGPVRVEAK